MHCTACMSIVSYPFLSEWSTCMSLEASQQTNITQHINMCVHWHSLTEQPTCAMNWHGWALLRKNLHSCRRWRIFDDSYYLNDEASELAIWPRYGTQQIDVRLTCVKFRRLKTCLGMSSNFTLTLANAVNNKPSTPPSKLGLTQAGLVFKYILQLSVWIGFRNQLHNVLRHCPGNGR